MMRISVKPSMYAVLTVVVLLAGMAAAAHSQAQQGTAIGPGVGNQVHAFAFDPTNTNVAYAGGDVCGVYKFTWDEAGGSWEPWSEGLGTGILNKGYYVDDLLVVRDEDISPLYRGVYAATHGGIYFRGDLDYRWRLLTGEHVYQGGYANRVFFGGSLHVPFSCLAFDDVHHVLYAGAGHGRTISEAPGDKNNDFKDYYPTTGGHPGAYNNEISLWSSNLTSGQQFAKVTSSVHGKVRQIAVAQYASPSATTILYACDDGVYAYQPYASRHENIWPSAAKTGFLTDLDSEDPWGVGVGSNGSVYVLTSRFSTSLDPGLWTVAMDQAGAIGAWTRVRDTIDLATGVATDYLWPGLGTPPTWSGYLDAAGDLSELTVIPGTPDEIFVGEGRNDGTTLAYGLAGYFRYGKYSDGGAQKIGWAHIHRTTYNSGLPVTVNVADWRNGDIQEAPMTDLGWLGYYPYLNALTPFAVHPADPDIMAGIDYGIPMMTKTGDTNWSNLYCKRDVTGLGWTTRGLNLMCSRSSAVLSDGRLVLGAMDWGVFCAVNDDNDAFNILRSDALPSWPHCWDLEVVAHGGHEEIFMVDDKSAPDKLWKWVDGVSSAWTEVSTALTAGVSPDTLRNSIRITDTVFLDSNTVVAAVGRRTSTTLEGMHFYLYKGVRTSDGWDWTIELDAGPAVAVGQNTKWINSLAAVPGTTKLLFGAKYKSRTGGYESGGLFCVDYAAADWSSTLVSWFGDYTSTAVPTTARDRLGRNVTAIGVDRFGQYVYIGCSGHDQPSATARGGVVRLRLEAGQPVAGSETILAGDGPVGSDDGDEFGLANTVNYGPFSPAAQSIDWEYCTRINEIDVDPNNPLVAFVAVGYGNFQYSHDGFGAWRVDGTVSPHAWTPLWGADETGSGAKTMAISQDGTKLYVGSSAQEFFAIDLTLADAPTIVATAEYPLLAGESTAAHALAVRPIPAGNTTISKVTADLGPWGGSSVEQLFDDGVAPDLELGDGIFTSRRAIANFATAGTYQVPVFAQASDGGYTQSNVAVTVVASAAAPVIDPVAVYRLRAGSTDASHVLAVTVSAPRATTRVTANLSAVSGPADLRLRDDGAGEDVKADDGIFTSPRFAASIPTEGPYVASVIAAPMVGTAVTQSVDMIAVANSAKFTSDSEFSQTARLGDALAAGLTAQPYSSIYFRSSPNDDASKSVMITTFDDNTTVPGIWGRNYQSGSGEGAFVDRGVLGSIPWLNANLPAGSRGVCYADYDNDGDTDFFICNPTSGGKIYQNRLNESPSRFVNVTSAVCGSDSVYLAGAVTAAWGDYTGDGFVDLFVATATYTGPLEDLPMVTYSGGSGGDMRLFKNVMGAAMKKDLVFGSGSSPICLAGCWSDLDDDGDLDLVTTRYSGGGLTVLENHGINATHTGYLMEQVAWTPSIENIGANSITVIDYDHDSTLDLLLTEDVPLRKQAWVLRNNFGTSGSKTFEATGFGLGTSWNGGVVADFNLDGQDDFVLLPKEAETVPALYMSNGYATVPEFEEPWPTVMQTGGSIVPTYSDLGFTLGLRAGKTGGGFAADLDGDHGPDLFLGRNGGDHFLYRSTGTAGSTSHWLQVNLRTHGDSNGSLVGARVQVVANGKQWLKVVDGGSFRGGQGSNDLLFGLKSETNIDYLKVMFPSGETQSVQGVSVDTAVTVWEGNMDALTYGRPSSSYELQPGFVDWVFRWKSGDIKGDVRSDKVEVWPYGQPNNTFVLEYGMPSVSHSVYKESGVWVHELRWGGQQCSDGARWSFKVTSGAGTGGQTLTATQSANTAPVTYCLPENYGQ